MEQCDVKDSGYVLLWRDTILKTDICTDHHTFALFAYMLALATHQEYSLITLGVKLKPGQFTTTISKLAIAIGSTSKRVRGSIIKLENFGWLEREGQASYTLFTLIKWGDYQGHTVMEGKGGAKVGQRWGKGRAKVGQLEQTHKHIEYKARPADYSEALSALENKQTIPMAVDALRAGHDALLKVADMVIENHLRGVPEGCLHEFVMDFVGFYAGSDLKAPAGALKKSVERFSAEERSKPQKKGTASATPKDMFRAWDRLGKQQFEQSYSISHADYADKIRVDLADLSESDFGRKYHFRAVEAREIVVAWGY